MKLTLRLVALASIVGSAYAGSAALSGCSSNNPATDGGTDSSTGTDSGGKKDSGGQPDTGTTTDAADDAPAVTVDPVCNPPAQAASNGSCAMVDDAGTNCDPVTNTGCAEAGAACDFSNSGFDCYSPPNTQAVCQTCDPQNGPECSGTTTCVPTATGMACARFCCADSDCTPGHCDTTTLSGGQQFLPGVCVK